MSKRGTEREMTMHDDATVTVTALDPEGNPTADSVDGAGDGDGGAAVSIIYYKLLNEDGTPCNGGSGTYHLPHGKRPGKWMPEVAVDPCYSGYHLCQGRDLLWEWSGPALWIAEGRGEHVRHYDTKDVFAQVRLLARVEAWNERNLRLLACVYAERVLGLFETRYPDDARPRQAIEAARRFANGNATRDAMSAARDAARAAARDAAGDAARDAARAAARAAAGAAAVAAARAAAVAAAWDAAGAAAGDAAVAAAWDAAGAAAGDAARAWQRAALKHLLETGEVVSADHIFYTREDESDE